MNRDLKPGDEVVAIKAAGKDKMGRPKCRPKIGKRYIVTSIYTAAYGLGCTLKDLDPHPYRGYILFSKGWRDAEPGWYFRKLQKDDRPAEEKFIQLFKDRIREKV